MSGRLDDLTGRRFGRLVVTDRAENDSRGRTRWNCVCDCGNTSCTRASLLKRGTTQSCGCLNREISIKKNTTHGKTQTRLYSIWANMKNRCNCETNHAYKDYGERGITVCDEWQDFQKFLEWSLASGYEEVAARGKCTLERIENDRGYEPSNCRWATMEEQGNNRRNNRKITYNGETKTLSQWAKDLNINSSTLCNRLARGWDLCDALTRPVDKRGVDVYGKS